MTEPVLVPPGRGEIVGDAPDRRVEILSEHETLHATWSQFGPRREGADLHVHRHHTDLFYVLRGDFTLRLGIDDEAVVLSAGKLARMPPLVVHGFRNGTDAELRYLNFHAPGQAFADFLRAERDGRTFSFDQHRPPPDGGRQLTDAVIGREEVVADRPGLRVVLLADVEEIGISEVSSDPGSLSAPPHLHRRHVESFYVLEGELTFTLGSRDVRAEAGSWVQVPPGLPHAFAVPRNRRARFLDLHTPSCGFGSFVRRFDDARTDDERAAVQAAFDQVPV